MVNFCLEIRIFVELPEKSTFFRNLPRKIEISFKLMKKSKFFENLPEKIEIFWTRIHDPPDFKPD